MKKCYRGFVPFAIGLLAIYMGLAAAFYSSFKFKPRPEEDFPVENIGEFRGYKARAIRVGTSRRTIMLSDTTKHPVEFVYGVDQQSSQPNSRFNEISLEYLSEGHLLTKYANPDSLEVAYREVMLGEGK